MGEWIRRPKDTFRDLIDFFNEAWQELKKVHWPSLKETYMATFVVLVVVLIVAIYLALVDYGLTWAIQKILS